MRHNGTRRTRLVVEKEETPGRMWPSFTETEVRHRLTPSKQQQQRRGYLWLTPKATSTGSLNFLRGKGSLVLAKLRPGVEQEGDYQLCPTSRASEVKRSGSIGEIGPPLTVLSNNVGVNRFLKLPPNLRSWPLENLCFRKRFSGSRLWRDDSLFFLALRAGFPCRREDGKEVGGREEEKIGLSGLLDRQR
ncbi:hypothetical protein KM043_008500 [Ampulex compressa]|nr:hypothetical protein KM043_008500 [Ampulex compressa]